MPLMPRAIAAPLLFLPAGAGFSDALLRRCDSRGHIVKLAAPLNHCSQERHPQTWKSKRTGRATVINVASLDFAETLKQDYL